MESIPMVTFKLTAGQQDSIQLAYQPNKTISEYVDDLADLYDSSPENIKLVFKGKILNWKQSAEKSKLKAGTVMVVLNNIKKEPKKVVPSKEQVVPGAGMSTGLGASSPFGVGGYEMVNHPQYMSAISSAVDPDKMEDIMNDPQYQGMLESMLEDPDTLRQLMNENPMLRNMISQNPSLKMIMQNPALMKMVFNKDMIKKSQEFLKKGGNGTDPEEIAQNFMNDSVGVGPAAQVKMPPMGSMMGQPGSGGFGTNPFMFPPSPPVNNHQPQSGQSQGANQPLHPFQVSIQNAFFTNLYKNQLKELQEYGFKDKAKNLQALRQTKGNVDEAMQKLCSQ